MARSLFDPDFAALPARLPIFPLPGALLLPGGRLPLNIFEPRYLAMTADVLKGERLIGMLQPAENEGEPGSARVFPIGCAGRIVEFSETDDGRYLITLAGLIRFHVAGELSKSERGYRLVRPDYGPFHGDLEEDKRPIDRPALLTALRAYFQHRGLKTDWKAIDQAPDEQLVTTLAMLCPFDQGEKQALLEAPGLPERAAAMTTILKLGVHAETPEGAARRH